MRSGGRAAPADDCGGTAAAGDAGGDAGRPPAPAAKAASPGAADGIAKIQQEFFDCAMFGRYQEMRRLAKHAAVDVNSIKIQGKTPLGIMCFRGEVAEIEFLLDRGANRVGPEMLPDGKETDNFAADMSRVVETGVAQGRCSHDGMKAALAFITKWYDESTKKAAMKTQILERLKKEKPDANMEDLVKEADAFIANAIEEMKKGQK